MPNVAIISHTLVVLALLACYVVTRDEVLLGVIVGQVGGAGVQAATRRKPI